jgi:hypothetical protein
MSLSVLISSLAFVIFYFIIYPRRMAAATMSSAASTVARYPTAKNKIDGNARTHILPAPQDS